MEYYSGFFPITLGAQAPLPMRTVAKHPRSEAKGGTLNSVIQYTAFGEIRSTQGITPTKYRYTGQLAQAELGLDYYVARWYDPLTGHFTQADTVVPEPGKASAFDRYAYVQNNPLRYNDPNGHKESGECGDGDNGKCRKKKKIVDPPKPPEPHCKVGDDCQTQTPTATSTTTPFRFQINTLFAPGSTPTPKTLLNSGSTKTPTLKPSPVPQSTPDNKKLRIAIDWSKVDYVDFGIDLIGISADTTLIVSSAIGMPEIGAVAEGIGTIVEGVGLIKSVTELITGNPQSALIQYSSTTIKIDYVIYGRAGRMVPLVGLIGNGVSLYANLKPKFEYY